MFSRNFPPSCRVGNSVMALFSWFRVFPAVMALLLIAGRSAAAEPDRPADTSAAAREILERFVTVSGGETTLKKQTSRLTTGNFEAAAMGVTGSMEILQATPKKLFQKLRVGDFATLTFSTDGQTAWIDLPGLGVQEMEEEVARQFIEDADMMALLNHASRLTHLVVKAPATIEGTPCVVVGGTNSHGQAETIYLGKDSGLMVRWDRPRLDPAGQWTATETLFSDYREVDGMKLPFKVEQKAPSDQAFTMVVTRIEHGVPAPEERFKKPKP